LSKALAKVQGQALRKEIEQALAKIEKSGARFKSLNPVLVCRGCWSRFAEFSVQLGPLRRYRFYGCRRCQALEPRLEGVERIVMVFDRRTESRGEATRLQDEVLYVFWFPHQPITDLDEVIVGPLQQWDLRRFYIRWAERADEVQHQRLKTVPVRLLPSANLSQLSQNLLKEWFAEVQPLPPEEAAPLETALGLT